MKKRVNANELQKGDIIYFYDNRNKFVKTREVKEIKHDDKYKAVEIIDTNGDEFWLNYHQKFSIDRKNEDINEVKRMQELAGINENSILSDEAYDRIDGLVNQKDMDMLRDGGRNIVLDLIDEGFEDEEIIEYICRYLKNFL
jgi:hypothetical protein